MFIRVSAAADGSGELTLEEPDDCTRLHLSAAGVGAPAVAVALARMGAGSLRGDQAFVEPASIERLAAGRVAAGWPVRFEAMIAYAELQGWVRDDGTIQAHIDWA